MPKILERTCFFNESFKTSWFSFIFDLKKQLTEKNISIDLSDTAKKWLSLKGFSEIYGARPLERLIKLKIKEPIADYLLSNSSKSQILIKISLGDNNKLKFNFITEKRKEKII